MLLVYGLSFNLFLLLAWVVDMSNWGLVVGSFFGFFCASTVDASPMSRLAWVVFSSAFFGFVWSSRHISFARPGFSKVCYRLLSSFAIVAFVSFVYWLIPEYDKPLYNPFFTFANRDVPR